jgi:hypothetical protein
MSKYGDVEDKKQAAMELLKSPRGSYIISRALLFTLERFKSVEEPLRENSDIDDMELLLNELFGGVKEDSRPHLGRKIYKGWPTKGDSPGFLTLVGGKDLGKIMAADLYQVLWKTDSDNWILETPMDPGAEPQELTLERAREWFLSTGPANAKLAKKYFPEGGK